MKRVGFYYPFLFRPPVSQMGKLSSVHFRLLNADGTIFQDWSQIGIVEHDYGYLVELVWNTPFKGSISWRILNTFYAASEEIVIEEFNVWYDGFGL